MGLEHLFNFTVLFERGFVNKDEDRDMMHFHHNVAAPYALGADQVGQVMVLGRHKMT